MGWWFGENGNGRTPHEITACEREYQRTPPDPKQQQVSLRFHIRHAPSKYCRLRSAHLHKSLRRKSSKQASTTRRHAIESAASIEDTHARQDLWYRKRISRDTHVCVSPFGAKNQATPDAATTTMRPMMMLQLNQGLAFQNPQDREESKLTRLPSFRFCVVNLGWDVVKLVGVVQSYFC